MNVMEDVTLLWNNFNNILYWDYKGGMLPEINKKSSPI